MALFYVTGLSGSGKSAVLKELQARGFEAHGVDEDGFGKWVNKSTGIAEEFPKNQPKFDIHEWYKDHDWVLDEAKIAALKTASGKNNRTVFLCGVASGDKKVWSQFTAVFALIIDEATLRQRIAQRTDNFGKTPEEMKTILHWHAGQKDTYRRLGAHLVDATVPVNKVVDTILAFLT